MRGEYSGIFYDYKARVWKHLLGPIFLSIVIVLLILSQNPITENILFWPGIVILFGILIYLANRNAKDFVYRIQIDKNHLTVNGQTYNRERQIEIAIADLSIKLKSKHTRSNKKYILLISNKNVCLQINEYNNWSDIDLADIFEQVKANKNEKIILDEKLILNQLRGLD